MPDASTWTARYAVPGAEALYLHIPFCASKCAYCDFASWATRPQDPLTDAYAAALLHEMEALEAAGALEEARTGYIGGGTPSLLGERLVPLAEAMSALVEGELSSEANPDSLTADLAASLKEAGLTRISLGVQSTDPETLRSLGRIHTGEEAKRALRAAVAAGLDVSADLMCALPGGTPERWARSLADVLSTGVEHVSVYPLAIEEGTAFGRRFGDTDPAWNDPDVQASRMLQAKETLEAAGFSRYEVASYARPGHSCRHNQAYWSGRCYLGLGTGASGMAGRACYERLRTVYPQLPELEADVVRVRIRNASDRRRYAEGDLSALSFELELLDGRQALAEDLMLAARMAKGIEPDLVAAARDVLGDAAESALGAAQEQGLLDASLAPTERGWLCGNELFGLLWGCAGDAPTRVRMV